MAFLTSASIKKLKTIYSKMHHCKEIPRSFKHLDLLSGFILLGFSCSILTSLLFLTLPPLFMLRLLLDYILPSPANPLTTLYTRYFRPPYRHVLFSLIINLNLCSAFLFLLILPLVFTLFTICRPTCE